MTTDKIRAEFEAIGRKYGNNLSKVDDYYLNDDTAAAWQGFQAGIQSQQDEIRRLREIIRNHLDNCVASSGGYSFGPVSYSKLEQALQPQSSEVTIKEQSNG